MTSTATPMLNTTTMTVDVASNLSTTTTDANNDNGPPFPDYLVYLQLGQNVFTLFAHLTTITTMGIMLMATHFSWKIVRITQLSAGLRLFFSMNSIFSIFGIIYHIYRILYWTSPKLATASNNWGNFYDPELLFWLSTSEIVYYGSMPATVLLLTLERCLTLKFPFYWITRNFPTISWISFIAIVGYNIIGHLVEYPLDYTTVDVCQTASCTTTKYRLYFQIISTSVFSCADVIISVIFLILLRGSGAAKKLKNRVILFTLLIEFVLGVLPTFYFVVINKFTTLFIGGVPNGGEKGELGMLFCALDTATCGLLYMLCLIRWNKTTSVGSVIHITQHQQPQPQNGMELNLNTQLGVPKQQFRIRLPAEGMNT